MAVLGERPTELGEVIAEREARFEVAGGSRAVVLRFGRPIYPPSPEEGDPWWCPLQIEGLGSEEIKPIAGYDSLQALLLALRFVRDYLPAEAARAGGRVYWITDDMDTIFDDRLSIERQTSQFLGGARRRGGMLLLQAGGPTALKRAR